MIRKRPGAAGDFNQRFDSLATDLKDLDKRAAAVAAAGASRDYLSVMRENALSSPKAFSR